MTKSGQEIVRRSGNLLLGLVPDSEWAQLSPHLQPVELKARQVLYERNRTLDFAYFPMNGCVSLLVDFVDGFQAEGGLVGFEGMVGLPLIHGIRTDLASAVVQVPAVALRISAVALLREIEQLPGLARVLMRYGESIRAQTVQAAACNGHHMLDVRLARCLLTLLDRLRAGTLPVTHEMLAGLLCAHRPSVSVAAKRLQRAGLIHYSGGQLHVLDRAKLEEVSCECYRIMRNHPLSLLEAAE